MIMVASVNSPPIPDPLAAPGHVHDCPQVSSSFALCSGDMTAKTAGWAIGITLLCVVLLSAVATVLLGIADWAVGVFLPG